MKKNYTTGGAKAPPVGSKVEVQIEKLAIGGAGIARHEGLVIFIPDTAPGEKVLAELTKVKKNFAEGRLTQILEASSQRRTPPCPVADRCGGCNWQHLTEAEQQRQKEQLVLETIRKFNPGLDFEYLPLVASPRAWRYRNRIQPKYRNGVFGFFMRHSHEIVPITDCPITEETLTEKFSEAQEWLKKGNFKGLQKLEMYIAANGEVRRGLINEEDDGVGFSQVNRFQNEDLIRTVLRWTQNETYSQIWDLYAGAGNFTFPLADAWTSARVTGVELNRKLVKTGQEKSRDPRVQFVESDVEKFLQKSPPQAGDLVLLDPPRAGASEETMKILAQSKPAKIVYISCHPVSLARDLKRFFEWCERLGIRAQLTRVQAFEMFPQTDHVETIAELRVDS